MSDNDGNTPVDVDTDDLTAFEAVFYDKAKVEPEAEVAEDVVEDEVVEDATETETDDDGHDDEVEPEDEESEPEPEQKPKNRKSAKERITELASQKREEREARLVAEARLADLEARLAKTETKEEAKPAAQRQDATVGPDPDATDEQGELIYPLGEFDPKYVADLTRHHFRLAAEEAKTAAAKEAEEAKAKAETEQLTTAWESRLEDTEAQLPDLREKLLDLEETFADVEPSYGIYLAETIMKMDRGPEVLYYLANNIDEAQKIVASGQVAATLALGRLEGLMSEPIADKRNEKKVSKAPVPPASSRGTAVAKVIAGDTDDLEAFELAFYGKAKS